MKIEVTKEAAVKLIGDDSKTWRDVKPQKKGRGNRHHLHRAYCRNYEYT